jgi:hypothetical protein
VSPSRATRAPYLRVSSSASTARTGQRYRLCDESHVKHPRPFHAFAGA